MPLKPHFFVPGILIGMLAGFVEETGWMGFVFPKILLKHTILTAGVLLGLVHAFWHVAANFLSNSAAFGIYWLPYFLGFSVFVLALRILIVWVYAITSNLLLAQLMHTSSTGFLAILVPVGFDPESWAIFYGT